MIFFSLNSALFTFENIKTVKILLALINLICLEETFLKNVKKNEMRYMYTFQLKKHKKMITIFQKVYDQGFKKKEHHFYSLVYKHFKEVWRKVESLEGYNPSRDLMLDIYSSRFYTFFIEHFDNLKQIDLAWSEWAK